MKKKIQISIRSLVEQIIRSGDLTVEFTRPERASEGIRAQRTVQAERPEEYIREVPVAYQVETNRVILELAGRIDGIYQYPDRVIIEEIKSTEADLSDLEKGQNPAHWAQVKCYAYFYAQKNCLAKIETQLTYYHMRTGEIREYRLALTLEELKEFFDELISGYLEWVEKTAEWEEIRNGSIQELEFPFSTYRPGQRQMAVEVYRTVTTGDQLLLQAPTGIGKTMAAIFPSIKAMVEDSIEKIFYLTARTTGRFAAEEALDQLRNAGLCLKSVTLTAKDKICFRPEAACNGEECLFAKGYYDRIGQALIDAFRVDDYTREKIELTAERHRVCPFEFSLDLSLWMDIIICDYNYVFDPRVYLRRFFLRGNGAFTFLVDEAHNLVDRSREMFSAEIYKQPFLKIRREFKDNLPELHRTMGRISRWLSGAKRKYMGEESVYAQKEPPEDVYPLLERFLENAGKWLSLKIQTSYRQTLLDLYFEVSGFMRAADRFGPAYTTCFEQVGRDLRIKLFCVDPSEHLTEVLKKAGASVFFSATLTPLDYFQEILGINDTAAKTVLPSPFPNDNLLVMISRGISTVYSSRKKTRTRVGRAIGAMVSQRMGNYLIYLPSYAYLRMILESFAAEFPGVETIVQTPGMTEESRESFLARFSRDNPETLVGFAVMGGIFGEGIDLVGDRLTGVVIVSVGLPGLSIEREVIRDYFAQKFEAGFEYAYLFPGLNRVLQAAGRVIRTENDRGVVFLIDDRFSSYRYRSLLPGEWEPVRIGNEEEAERALKKFW